MIPFDETTLNKIADAKAKFYNHRVKPVVYQFVKINWQTGAKYYANIAVTDSDTALPVESVTLALTHEYFLPMDIDSSLDDKEIPLEIWDGGTLNPQTNEWTGGGEFADTVYAEGEGVKTEIYFWIPAADLFFSVWTGHLRSDKESDAYYWRGRVANGFRSPNLPIGRAHWSECQAIYGKLLDTQEEIDLSGCPHNAHLPEGERSLPVIGNSLHASCPRLSVADCVARGVPPAFHLSHATQSVAAVNNQTSGQTLYSVSRGNETALKKPVRIVMGTRRVRDCEVLAFARHYNNNTPDRGFFEAIYELCEGPIQGVYSARITVGGGTQNANPQHYSYRLGLPGQSPIEPVRLTTHSYSRTAHFRYNFGWINPGGVDPASCRGEGVIAGLNDIRVYAGEGVFTTSYTSSRVWQIARMLADRFWGHGLDYARLHLASFVETAEYLAPSASFTTPEGTVYNFQRGESNVELDDKSVQQQIEDMCLAGRLTRPFQFDGKLAIAPIRPLTPEELAACPVFTDEGLTNRNIAFEGGRSTLKRAQKDDLDLPNRIEATFDDAAKDWLEQTAPPVEDVDQQLLAGRIQGDKSRRKVTKKYSFLGVTDKSYAVMLAYWILWFGEFNEGGIKNNLEITFTCWFLDALALHEFKVIRVLSSQLNRAGFEYFQIKKLRWRNNLHVEIVAQAFNQDALAEFETAYEPPDPGGEIPPGGDLPNVPNQPCELRFGAVRYAQNVLEIDILPC